MLRAGGEMFAGERAGLPAHGSCVDAQFVHGCGFNDRKNRK
jgi:hypothetical protein